jgi:pimeloyl-ACP methyl ester carboxylesterase
MCAAGFVAGSPEATATTPPVAPFEPAAIDWTTIGDHVEEGWLDVPIDYTDPAGGMFRLFLARRLAPAESRIGSLLVNPGGPGFGGTIYAYSAPLIFDQALLDSFDIVAWDPRGTGRSEPFVDCIDDYDDYYAGTDVTPDDDGERQHLVDVAHDFAVRCADDNADIVQFIGTNSSARDIDTIRVALGEDEISYYGFSYGSELGAVWATLFPATVRAAVLDGAADPTVERTDKLIARAAGFDATLATFLAECSADPGCPLHHHGDAEAAFDALMLAIDETPLPTVADRPLLTRGMALDGVVGAMYSRSFWRPLGDALAAAERGDGAPLLGFYDSLYQRRADGSWDNSLEAYQAITCMDSAERRSVDDEDAATLQFVSAAPRLGLAIEERYACTFFPDSTDPRIDVTGGGAGPILVCGVTGDPATPLQGTRTMAETLEDGRLVVIEADQHTCYGATSCADELIVDYLVNLTAPPVETEC